MIATNGTKSLPDVSLREPRGATYYSLSRWPARAMSSAMASVAPLRYPILKPRAPPPSAQQKKIRQTRAASSVHNIEASDKRRGQVIYQKRRPTTNSRASQAGGRNANHPRRLGLAG